MRVKELAYTWNRIGSSSSIHTANSMKRIRKPSDSISPRDVLEITSGTMKVNYDNSFTKFQSKQYRQLFLKSDLVSDLSEGEQKDLVRSISPLSKMSQKTR